MGKLDEDVRRGELKKSNTILFNQLIELITGEVEVSSGEPNGFMAGWGMPAWVGESKEEDAGSAVGKYGGGKPDPAGLIDGHAGMIEGQAGLIEGQAGLYYIYQTIR